MRVTEDEMAEWHHKFNGHELGQILGDGKEKGSLVCYRLWSHRVRHDLETEQKQQIYTSCRIFFCFVKSALEFGKRLQ